MNGRARKQDGEIKGVCRTLEGNIESKSLYVVCCTPYLNWLQLLSKMVNVSGLKMLILKTYLDPRNVRRYKRFI